MVEGGYLNAIYRNCLIGWRGYYLFHLAILCGVHSRTATIRERHLLYSAMSVHGTSNPQRISGLTPLQMFKRMRWVGGEWTCSRRQLIHYAILSDCVLFDTILRPHRVMRFVHVRTYYSNNSHSYYSRVATISLSTSRGAATIQKRRRIENGVWSNEYGIPTWVWYNIIILIRFWYIPTTMATMVWHLHVLVAT